MIPDLEAYLRRATRNHRVLDRAMAANADWQPGQEIRAWRQEQERSWAYGRHCISRGRFIRALGRARWDALPHALRLRRGRRCYAAWTDMVALRNLPDAQVAAAAALYRDLWPGRVYADAGWRTVVPLTEAQRLAWRQVFGPGTPPTSVIRPSHRPPA